MRTASRRPRIPSTAPSPSGSRSGVRGSASAEVADNAEVGCIAGDRVLDAARSLDLAGTDALVVSACVQMPSLPLVQQAEDEFGLPVLSAATAGAFTLLDQLGLPVDLPDAGRLLARDAKVGA